MTEQQEIDIITKGFLDACRKYDKPGRDSSSLHAYVLEEVRVVYAKNRFFGGSVHKTEHHITLDYYLTRDNISRTIRYARKANKICLDFTSELQI